LAMHMFLVCVLLGISHELFAQTAATGALRGTVTDPSGGVLPGVTIKVTSATTGQTRTAVTQANGAYLVPFLPVAVYRVEASNKGFKTAVFEKVEVDVTETKVVDVHLEVGSFTETVTVEAQLVQIETNSSALGNVTDQRMIDNAPLVTRNYLQILGLSPGVSSEIANAAGIGRGSAGIEYSTSGNIVNDNNFQMNGAEVNDLMGSGTISGGIPVPNPDSIQEFKVQTGQYDASYGRNAGANVDVVTKSGTNAFHGDIWEYFRNTALNANDYFLNQNHQPRGVLNENQFGGAIGGPIRKDRVFFFVSYQGTRERDGLDVTGGCLSGGNLPVGLSNDPASRTAAALASTFNIATPIDPTALAVLNAKLPNGQFVIPAPQNAAGTVAFSSPCPYSENQFVSNLDFYHTEKSHFSGKFFFSNSSQTGAFPGNNVLAGPVTVPGFPQNTDDQFRDFSLTHTYTFNDHLINQAVIAYHRTVGLLNQTYPKVTYANGPACPGNTPGVITLASICVPAPAFDNPFPQVLIVGAFNMGGNGQGVTLAQNFYNAHDSITLIHGKHSLHVGGGVDRSQINEPNFHFLAALAYFSFDSLLTGNPAESVDVPGLFGRAWRTWNGDAFVQDDYKVLPHLTLNLGFRYERQGQLGETLGRASTFNVAAANPNPPAAGTLQGYVVSSNFPGTLPTGPDGSSPTRASTNTALNNDGQNGWEPRIGFAWQLPGMSRSVLRGGYGIYYTRTTGQPFFQLLASPPFGLIRQIPDNGVSTAFPAFPPLPFFPPYSPTTQLTPSIFSPNFRPPIIQQYSMDVQTEVSRDMVLDIGYHGSRGSKLIQQRAWDQALDATVTPLNGQTNNTLFNRALRQPFEGFNSFTATSTTIESAGASWYNALGVSLNKRFSHGLQFLASYTWTSALETDPGYVNGTLAGGSLQGNQIARSNYGFDNFVRPQRLVLSYVYNLPGLQNHFSALGRVLSGWSVAGVTTFQSGQKLTISETDEANAFGIVGFDQERANVGNCTVGQLTTHGSVTSRLNGYFNPGCFTVPAIIGADGIVTAFGNGGLGNVIGPAQQDFDISITKKIPFGHNETRGVEFRAEFFNAFNTPSFANPTLDAGTVCVVLFGTCPPGTSGNVGFAPNPAFGVISTTSVAPRIIQFALKLYF
ncbi:MAG TPA: carboxypeptidase-like regulatory domain-containing protein, partial [Candidatus Eremiobacteraceae bacterium]|nr:carboxypeptidase-like regulatory domain-containing protein [Candidatus Eremiobacteraceae bacterium]